jgi:hypothetical protein
MKDQLSRATRIAKRTAPVTLAAAAVAFSLGAYSGQAEGTAAGDCDCGTFTLVLARKALTLKPGSTTRVKLIIHRHSLRQRVAFRVLSKLPRGISARFAPRRARGGRTILILRARTGVVAAGRYRVRIRAAAGHTRRTVTLTLKVIKPTASRATAGQPPEVTITGNAPSPLEPGAPQPIDVVIANPNPVPLTVEKLTVAIGSLAAPLATRALPCTQGEFALQQYSGALPLTIPSRSSRSLRELGIATGEWPEISLLELPANQDGCKGASLGLAFAAQARLG